MIDTAARIRAREVIEEILANGLHRDHVDKNWPRSRDIAVRSVAYWLWTQYDDDSDGVIRFHEGGQGREVLRNVKAFLGTSEPLSVVHRTFLGEMKHIFSAGLEWRGCELPWHERWPFAPGKNAGGSQLQ